MTNKNRRPADTAASSASTPAAPESCSPASSTAALLAGQELRRKAEAAFREKAALRSPGGEAPGTPESAVNLLHELQVHQIELEMQNEELRRAQSELEIAHARYFDLYDQAPVGYCTVSEQGIILEANLTVAALLGLSRQALARQRLTRFVLKEDQDTYYLHRKQILDTGAPQTFELRMVKTDGTAFSAHLEAAAAQNADGAPVIRVVITDNSARKETEERLRYVSMHDVMTGLQNRAYFDESMERLERGRQYPISVLVADVDELKVTNDRGGHAAGDSLLKAVARLLREAFRAEDVIARLGGDEFAVLMPGTSAVAAEGALRRFRQLIRRHNAASAELPIWLSCGTGTVERGRLVIEALRVADTNMYLEKQSRRVVTRPAVPSEPFSPSAPEAPAAGPNLRDRAVQAYRDRADPSSPTVEPRGSPESPAAVSAEQAAGTLHQLRVHQIELEMQNEELRRAQSELETARARYFDLYDLAPVGYVTVSENGIILEANLSAATLLGLSRRTLARQLLTRFIALDGQDTYYQHRNRLVKTGEPQAFDLRMLKADGKAFPAHLECRSGQDADGATVIRVVLSDITERWRVEEVLVFLARTSSGMAGESFFESLARYLGDCLNMDYVCIDRLEGDGLTARTMAVWHDGKFEDNVAYALKDTPCGVVVGKPVCCFPASVRQFFPRDQALQDLRAESYVGVTLWSHAGEPIGLIAVIGRRPLVDPSLAEATLRLVAVRAAGELERLDAEQTLRASEERYRTILQIALDGFWVVDLQGRFVDVNAAYCRMSGYSQAELLGMGIPDVEAREASADTQEHIRTVMAQGHDRFESLHRRKDGSLFDVEVSVQYRPSDGGSLIASLRDITGSKRAEATLRESEGNLRQAQHVGHLGSWRWDIKDNHLTWSDEMYRIFGIAKEDFSGSLPDVVARAIHPDDREKVEASNRLVVQQGRPVPLEYRVVRPDGSVRVVWAEAGEVTRDGTGNPASLTGIVLDITERKSAEEQLRRGLREKEVLLGEVHHRVKNNLNVISSLLNLQSAAIRTPAQALAALQNSRDRIKAMALVHNKLYESRDYSRVDMTEYLQSLTRQIMKAVGSEKRVVLITWTEGVVLGVDAAVPCGLITNELITNAVKYAFPPGSPGEIRVVLKAVDGAVDEADYELSVSDNGIGLPEGYEDPERGTLGLTLVRLLTDQLDGAVEVRREGGTSIRVRFPDPGAS